MDKPKSDAESHMDFLIMCGMILVVVVPIMATMWTIEKPGIVSSDWDLNPTPYGYTIRLSLFILPTLLIGWWFVRHRKHPVEFKALLLTTLVIFIGGGTLDLFFGYSFFEFPNTGATLGIRVPAFSFEGQWHWERDYLPIEEFGFYLFGALYTVAIYAWGDLYWFRAHNATNYASVDQAGKRLIRPHWRSSLSAVALMLLAVLVKKYFPHTFPEGFPGYCFFLILIALLPSLVLLHSVKPFINWRSFAFVNFNLMWLSFFWEASLATRFGWWRYKTDQMMGLMIHNLQELPIEAVLLWLAIAWAIVIIYETFCICLYRSLALSRGDLPGGTTDDPDLEATQESPPTDFS